MTSSVETIREKLRQAIRGSTKSQEEVAEAVGLHPSSLSRMLAGSRPITLDQLSDISKVVGVEMGTLVSVNSFSLDRWTSVPVISLRSVPAMRNGFSHLVEEVEKKTRERISLPGFDGPALAIPVPNLPSLSRLLNLTEGEVVVVVDDPSPEPGRAVVIQVSDRTHFGMWQVNKGRHQVLVEGGIVYEEEEFVLLGRVRWHFREV